MLSGVGEFLMRGANKQQPKNANSPFCLNTDFARLLICLCTRRAATLSNYTTPANI